MELIKMILKIEFEKLHIHLWHLAVSIDNFIIKSIKLEYYIVDSGAGEVATGAGGEEKRRGDGSDGQG